MAIIALLDGATFDVVPSIEIEYMSKLDEADSREYRRVKSTVFHCRIPNADQHAKIINASEPTINNGEMTFRKIGEAEYIACLFCLIGWDNVLDEDGNQVKFKGVKTDGKITGATLEDVSHLQRSLRSEIYMAVKNKCSVVMRDFR